MGTLCILAKLIDQCIKIYSHKLTCKLQEEEIRNYKLKNYILESSIKIHKEMIASYVDKGIDELQTEIGEKLSPEDRERTKLYI